MSLVIPDEFLQIAHISEADLKLEIAILLFQQEKLTLDTRKFLKIYSNAP